MKYRRALGLLSFLCPIFLRLGAVEGGTASADAKPAAAAAAAPANSPEQGDSTGVTSPAAAAKPLTAGDFMSKLTAAFSAKATLVARVTELEGQLAAATTAKTDAETAKAAAESAKTAAETAKTTAETNLATANAALANLATAIGLKPEEIAGKSADDIKQAQNARIEARAGEKLAELGFPTSGLPASAETASAGATGDALADIQAQLATEKDPKKAGELAAKANKLRDAKWGIKPGNN